MMNQAASRKSWLLLTAGLIAYLVLAARTLPDDNQLDLFVYRTGAQLALAGESPYDSQRMSNEIAKTFPPKDANDFANNCGFFLPPQGIVLFSLFAKMKSWVAAEAVWFLLLTLFGISAEPWPGRSAARRASRMGWAIIVVVLLLNPVTLPTLVVGQTPLLFAGCIALGQYCFERQTAEHGLLPLGTDVLQAEPGVAVLALAAILGGWKRAGGIALIVALLNLLGGLLTYRDARRAFRPIPSIRRLYRQRS